MNLKLKISVDLGVTYCDIKHCESDVETLKAYALHLEKKGQVRWVLVDESDMPVYWCQYIEATLRVPKDRVIATDDMYMAKLAKKNGFRVMTSVEMLRNFVDDPNLEERIKNIKVTPEMAKQALSKMDEMLADGTLEMAHTDMDSTKVGKELFGDE